MEIPPATRRLMLRIALDRITSEDYVVWAFERAEEGADSPHLWMLAGMTKPLYWSEVDAYFARALEELGEVLPERNEFLICEAREIVCSISTNLIEPVEGCHQLADIHEALNYDSEFERFYHVSHEMSALFGELPEDAMIYEIKDAARRFIQGESPPERWQLANQPAPRPSIWASIRRFFP